MSLEKFYIPKHLDDAPRFLLWSIDEAMSALVPVFLPSSAINLGSVSKVQEGRVSSEQSSTGITPN